MWPAIAAAAGSTVASVGGAVLAGRSEGRMYDDLEAERRHELRLVRQARRSPSLVSGELLFGLGMAVVAVVVVKASGRS